MQIFFLSNMKIYLLIININTNIKIIISVFRQEKKLSEFNVMEFLILIKIKRKRKAAYKKWNEHIYIKWNEHVYNL